MFSGWDRLGQDRVYNANRASADIPLSMQAAANALFEVICGGVPPGEQSSYLKGHDHGRFGGVPLARGTHYCMNTPEAGSWTLTTALAYSFPVSPARKPPFRYPGVDFVAKVPFGIDSSTQAVSGANVMLECYMEVYVPPTITGTWVDFRLKNTTNPNVPTYSSAQRVTTPLAGALTLLVFDDVPVVHDQWNLYTIQTKTDAVPGAGYETICEVASVNLMSTRGTSQPISAGLLPIPSASKP